jgi:hypothetical protein
MISANRRIYNIGNLRNLRDSSDFEPASRLRSNRELAMWVRSAGSRFDGMGQRFRRRAGRVEFAS